MPTLPARCTVLLLYQVIQVLVDTEAPSLHFDFLPRGGRAVQTRVPSPHLGIGEATRQDCHVEPSGLQLRYQQVHPLVGINERIWIIWSIREKEPVDFILPDVGTETQTLLWSCSKETCLKVIIAWPLERSGNKTEKYAAALNIHFIRAKQNSNFKGLGMCSKSRIGGLCFSLHEKQLLKSSLNERKWEK